MRTFLPAVCVALALLRGAPAFAQDAGPDPANVRVRIGPLMINPTLSLSNLGIDHNVFNDPPDKAPKEDFTFTVTPLSDFWLRLGPTWVTAQLNEQINWYKKYASERTANSTYKLGWSALGSRMNFKVNGQYINTRERPGYEIDTRAAHKDTTFTSSIDFHALSKSLIGVSAGRTQSRFSSDAEFLAPTGTIINLQTALNHVSTNYALNFRQQLTPLTTFTLSATRNDDKFEFSPDRDSTATGALASLAFTPQALIRGGVSVGYSDFRPNDATLPDFRGLVGTVDVTYVLLGSTRFAATGGRSVQYSYDVNQPYYVQSRIGGSVAQQIFGPFDVQLRGDIAYLDYRDRSGASIAVTDRQDRVTTIGLGVGFHIGRDLRFSFNVDQNNRDTRVQEHQYEKFLIGTALTYGF